MDARLLRGFGLAGRLPRVGLQVALGGTVAARGITAGQLLRPPSSIFLVNSIPLQDADSGDAAYVHTQAASEANRINGVLNGVAGILAGNPKLYVNHSARLGNFSFLPTFSQTRDGVSVGCNALVIHIGPTNLASGNGETVNLSQDQLDADIASVSQWIPGMYGYAIRAYAADVSLMDLEGFDPSLTSLGQAWPLANALLDNNLTNIASAGIDIQEIGDNFDVDSDSILGVISDYFGVTI